MKRLVLIGVATMVLGLIGVGATLAQDGGDEGGPVRDFIARVAAKLGISEEQLQTAITDAQREMLDEAVAEGRLTPEQAERLRERIDEGGVVFPRLREHGPRHGPCHRVARLVVNSAAQVLGVEKDELLAQIKEGKSLAEIAEAHGFSADDFKSDLLAQVRQTLDGLVADGKLTEQQAATIFERVEENIDTILNGHVGPDDRPCHRGHHRRPHGEDEGRPLESGLPSEEA